MSEPATLHAALIEVAEHQISRPGARPTINDIVDVAEAQYPQLVAAQGEHLVRQQMGRIVRDALRQSARTSAQLALPGLKLPSAIAVRENGSDVYYVATRQATWAELQAGETERVENVTSAQASLDEYREGLRILEPVMSDDLTLTVVDAVDKLLGGTA